ncbi:2,3-bisphosphoglycerate-independent phosphoglycerate mutase [Candidatus Berkelbacteria bacterium]|nr:2,3-bisphosphoglycerate-independent phosphoglycerate mutase [Candidatus Berkelbacteria bacterium]
MTSANTALQPVILVVLDGFGLSPIAEGNAIMQAKTPFLDWAIRTVPKALLHASGAEVGLDWGEMGNSEVGHFNLGTGRIVMQDLPRINRAIEDGSFFKNTVLLEAAAVARTRKKTLHVIGLASHGGVHAHLNHLLAMVDFGTKQKVGQIALHLITDGRDTPPRAFETDLPKIQNHLKKTPLAIIASVSGRYYAMDRDKRWDRTEQAYRAMVDGTGRMASSPAEALQAARAAKESDEFLTPTVITNAQGKPLAPIQVDDVVIFINFRPDRARQLAAALANPDFAAFHRAQPVQRFVSFGSYGQEGSSAIKVAFFSQAVDDQLAAVITKAGLAQLHIAETEKYAHVTYFFNGGQEDAFQHEERILIPSPKVATYDLKPAMSAEGIVDTLVRRLKKAPVPFVVLNFANPDMVGHTGQLAATIQAIETIDAQVTRIQTLARSLQAVLLITADHGNAEQLLHPETGEIDTEHTTNPVPLFLIGPERQFVATIDEEKMMQMQFAAQPPVGVLADIAPTILELLGLEKPTVMTGQSLTSLLQ